MFGKFRLLLFCFLIHFTAKSKVTDSLEKVLTRAKTPIEIISASNQLGIYYESRSNYPAALFYLAKAKKANRNNEFPEQSIITQNYIGYVYWHKSDYEKALLCHNKALKIAEENNIQDENLAFTYLMLGNDYYDKGDFNQTANYYFKCLKLAESIHNTPIQVQGHNRLSKLYFKLKDYSLAIEHVNTALLLNNKSDLRELATSYNSLGNIALEKQNIDSALYYFTQTLLNFRKCGDVIGQSIASINLGDTYLMFDNKRNSNYIDSSYYYYDQSYILNQSVDNKFGMIYGLWGMADIVSAKNNYSFALNKYREAMLLATQIGAKSEELNLYYKLFDLYDKKGIVDSSLFFLKKHVLLKNKVEGSEQAKQLLKQQSKYEFEKIIANEKAETEKEKLIEREKNKWKNIIIAIVIAVSIILVYVAYVLIKRLKIIRSKNELINTINEELHLQKKEIIDSITYAKRIQNVILPSNKLIKDNLPNNFILYLPKDIVAGDFYWLECVKGKGNNGADVVLFAAADCTGHGVPGAMVSVICNNGLNRSVREHGIINPSGILEKTRQIVVSEFEKSDEVVKDGMDISLCALTGKTLEWAGANNPLWIIRKNNVLEPNSKFQLIEIKADKQPIGKVDNPKEFINHTIELQKNDTIYLFTDGYQDQFGGEKGKKYKASQLKQLLLSIQEKTMEEQKQLLLENINSWRGNLEQVDDICIIGVKID